MAAAGAREAEMATQVGEILDRLKDREMSLADALQSDNPVIKEMLVRDLLTSMPQTGHVKADRIMADVEIAPNRRVRGLGHRQLAELVAYAEREEELDVFGDDYVRYKDR
jgi:hypothetical protein